MLNKHLLQPKGLLPCSKKLQPVLNLTQIDKIHTPKYHFRITFPPVYCAMCITASMNV